MIQNAEPHGQVNSLVPGAELTTEATASGSCPWELAMDKEIFRWPSVLGFRKTWRQVGQKNPFDQTPKKCSKLSAPKRSVGFPSA